MPNIPWAARRDTPVITGTSLAALLAGTELPAASPPDLLPVVDVLAALRAGPASDELAGEAAVLAEFRSRVQVPVPARRGRRQKPAWHFPILSGRAAATAAAAVLGFGGVATAAYAGALPAPIQQFAHDVFGAPSAGGTSAGGRPSAGQTPSGPGATSGVAYGLCTAWADAKAHGTAKQQAAAFHKLAIAAGGPGSVAAYCAVVLHPGASPSQSPAGKPASRLKGKSAPRPKGKPTPHPTPHGTGKPAPHPTPRRAAQP
jgi:hypothetical protein